MKSIRNDNDTYINQKILKPIIKDFQAIKLQILNLKIENSLEERKACSTDFIDIAQAFDRV